MRYKLLLCVQQFISSYDVYKIKTCKCTEDKLNTVLRHSTANTGHVTSTSHPQIAPVKERTVNPKYFRILHCFNAGLLHGGKFIMPLGLRKSVLTLCVRARTCELTIVTALLWHRM
jgi:hypothetical protein